MGRTRKIHLTMIPPNPNKIKVFSVFHFQWTLSISSQPRYDHFDTSPNNNYSILRHCHMISSQLRYDCFATSPTVRSLL